MYRIYFLAVILCSNIAFSACLTPQSFVDSEDIPLMTGALVENSFPELAEAWTNHRIVFRSFSSDSFFFKTGFAKGALAARHLKRIYTIDVNQKIFSMPVDQRPSCFAVEGILAHELNHIVDYENSGFFPLIGIYLRELFTTKKYERATDRAAFFRGYAPGIEEFRIWLYKQLSPRALRIKLKNYYTPEEIEQWMHEHPLN